jgi:hypothetical protein
MPITYTKQSHTKRLIEPLFSRFRQKYRGTRNSKKENLEINSLLADFNRINNQLDSISLTCDSYSIGINGKIFSLAEEEVLVDGVNVQPEGVTAYSLNIDATPSASSIGINDIVKITGKLSRLQNKIKFLENRI